jgi:uncharacterized protein (TIGR02246 family)
MSAQQTVVAAVVAAVIVGVGSYFFAGAGTAALEQRVRDLEDTQAIHALLVDYGRALDKRDYAAYGALFARDGWWKGGMGTATGPEAIGKMVEAGFGRMSPSLYEGSNHVMTSFDVELTGDTATAWSRWTWVVIGPDGKPQPERAGYYEDSLVREDGRWRFMNRQATTEINP